MENRKISVNISQLLYDRVVAIVDKRNADGETCTVSEIVRKSIIKFLKEK